MEKSFSASQLWDRASKAGVYLSIAPIAYMLYGQLITLHSSSVGIAFLISVLNFILWAVKFWLCIRLMKLFMQRFAHDFKDITNRDSFSFGVAIAFLSALIYAGFNLAYTSIIAPNTYSDAISLFKETYANSLTDDMLYSLENTNFTVLGFFVNLIYCTIYGTIVSAFLSRNIPSSNPFAKYNDDNIHNTDEQ